MKHHLIFPLLLLSAFWACKNEPIAPTPTPPAANTVSLNYNQVSTDFDYELHKNQDNQYSFWAKLNLGQSTDLVVSFNNLSESFTTQVLDNKGVQNNLPYAFIHVVLGGDAVAGSYHLDTIHTNFIRITAHDVPQGILTADLDAKFIPNFLHPDIGLKFPDTIRIQQVNCKLKISQ
ncbi:MAG: hypothetical protein KGS48_10850 [Bacteroidetes bacterium]|nr:hypothetical protein [Bacteroidota bacterium]